MKIRKTFSVQASADHVWKILGLEYEHADAWASSVFVSSAKSGTVSVAGAPVAGRTCQTTLGPFTESIIRYDDSRRHIAYSATGAKMPGFMRSLINSWTVEQDGPSSSRVTMELTADIAQPFALLMGWMMKLQFSSVLKEATDDLRVYAETGVPSARKRKADASKKGQAARAVLP